MKAYAMVTLITTAVTGYFAYHAGQFVVETFTQVANVLQMIAR